MAAELDPGQGFTPPPDDNSPFVSAPSADFLKGQQEGGQAATGQFGDATYGADTAGNDYGFGGPPSVQPTDTPPYTAPYTPPEKDAFGRPIDAATDAAGQQAASGFWNPLMNLLGGIGGVKDAIGALPPVAAVTEKIGQGASTGSDIARGELGILSATGENAANAIRSNDVVRKINDIVSGVTGVQMPDPSTTVNDAFNAAAQRQYQEDTANGVDTSDPLYQSELMMKAGRAAWGATDIPIPVVKGALESTIDPTNLAFAGAGPVIGMAKKATLGKDALQRIDQVMSALSRGDITAEEANYHLRDIAGARPRTIKDAAAGAGSKIDEAAHQSDLNALRAAKANVESGVAGLHEHLLVKDAENVAAELEAKGRPDQAQNIRDILSGKDTGTQTNLEKMIASGEDQSRSTAAERATEAAGGSSAATERLNEGLSKTVTGRNKAMVTGAGEDTAMDAATRQAVKERDSALKEAGVNYADVSDAAKERYDRMFGVVDTGDKTLDWLGKITAPLSTTSNSMRTLMTSWDFSMGRQAAGLAGGAPGSLGKGFASQGKALLMDEGEFRQATAKIIHEVDQYGGIEAGLHISGPGAFQEEKYIGSEALQKLPGVVGSEQAYTHGLNVARADAYVTGVKSMEEAAGRKLTDEERKQFASYINHATGRGDVPDRLKGAFEMVNGVFFAPRYRLSRAQVVTDTAGAMGSILKDVATAIKTGKPLELNPVDKKVLEFTGKYVGTIESLMRGAQFAEHLAGRENTYSDVGTPFTPEDATSNTFGKLDVGAPGTPGADVAGALELFGGGSSVYKNRAGEGETVKMDLWSGFAPELRTVIREFNNLRGLIAAAATGVRPPGTNKPGLPAYLRQGEAPLPGLIHTAISGKHDAQNFGENAVGQAVKRSDWTSTDPNKNPVLNELLPLSATNAAQDMGLFGPPSGGSSKGKAKY